jgi:hypothetical protein
MRTARRPGRRQHRLWKDYLQSIERSGVLYIPQMRNSKNAISRRFGSANYPHDREKMDAF